MTQTNFKVGDRVRRTGSTTPYFTKGCIYEVVDARLSIACPGGEILSLRGVSGYWDAVKFELVEATNTIKATFEFSRDEIEEAMRDYVSKKLGLRLKHTTGSLTSAEVVTVTAEVIPA